MGPGSEGTGVWSGEQAAYCAFTWRGLTGSEPTVRVHVYACSPRTRTLGTAPGAEVTSRPPRRAVAAAGSWFLEAALGAGSPQFPSAPQARLWRPRLPGPPHAASPPAGRRPGLVSAASPGFALREVKRGRGGTWGLRPGCAWGRRGLDRVPPEDAFVLRPETGFLRLHTCRHEAFGCFF